ncbi:MAG: hypothetical protein GC182_13985 [Rhodopseudomonas sp.]|nr:hypothetical protein [Rhodopseudomonas sp.]
MKQTIMTALAATCLTIALAPAAMAQAQSSTMTEAEVYRFLAGRTFQMNRGPATYYKDGRQRFAIRGGKVHESRWRPCGSAVCLSSGWRGALIVESGVVYLTDPQGNRIKMGRKR